MRTLYAAALAIGIAWHTASAINAQTPARLDPLANGVAMAQEPPLANNRPPRPDDSILDIGAALLKLARAIEGVEHVKVEFTFSMGSTTLFGVAMLAFAIAIRVLVPRKS